MAPAVKIILVLIVLAIVGGGAYAAFHKDGPPSTDTAATNPAEPQASPTPSDTSAPAAATITFTDDGFSPAVTTVKAGDTVQVVNKSNQELDFDSDPHPTHTDEPELNIGSIEPGKSGTFTVTQRGHWGFHDHLNPSLHGNLVVE